MGGDQSKGRRPRHLAALERVSSRKRYLLPSSLTTPGLVGTQGQANVGDRSEKEFPPFTEQQRALVMSTWRVVQADIARVGVTMFIKLFETHPEVQNVFLPFKGQTEAELQDSAKLRSHALRVMSTVDQAVQHLADFPGLHAMLQELGARHVLYSAKVDYMDLIGPQFIWAIEPVVGDQWTPEVEQAWSDLFKVISHIMKGAMKF